VRFIVEPRPAGGDDEANTAQTVARMLEYSTADAQEPAIKNATAQAIAGRRSKQGKAAGIFNWICARLHYVEDKDLHLGDFRPDCADAEILIRPADVLRMPQPAGDCDEYSMLARAMLLSAGIRASFITVECDEDAPGDYSHIYVRAYTPAALAFDAIPNAAVHGIGYEVAPTGKRREWSEGGNNGSRPTMKPYSSTPGALGNVGDFDWGSFAQTLSHDATSILGQRYGVPQLNPGQVIQRPDGTYLYQAPAGQGAGLFQNSAPGAGISTNMLLFAAVGFMAVLMVANKK
jgi:hypothetical protein